MPDQTDTREVEQHWELAVRNAAVLRDVIEDVRALGDASSVTKAVRRLELVVQALEWVEQRCVHRIVKASTAPPVGS